MVVLGSSLINVALLNKTTDLKKKNKSIKSSFGLTSAIANTVGFFSRFLAKLKEQNVDKLRQNKFTPSKMTLPRIRLYLVNNLISLYNRNVNFGVNNYKI